MYVCLELQEVMAYKITSLAEMGLAANTGAPLTRLKWRTVEDGGGMHAWPRTGLETVFRPHVIESLCN